MEMVCTYCFHGLLFAEIANKGGIGIGISILCMSSALLYMSRDKKNYKDCILQHPKP